MAEQTRTGTGPAQAADTSFRIQPPQLTLPKGGGAIRGLGEKFAANPVVGTGSLSVPIYVSSGRSGFSPQLSLSYDSGAGNGAFGFGWSLNLPAVTRKTDKGLPEYRDFKESDIFIISGEEDLIPALVNAKGQWTRDVTPPRTVYGRQYAIHRYRPRVEGLFARIERWINLSDPQDTFWRSISKDNITTWYGKTAESRIADPADPSRVFSWLICETYDNKGNVISYAYKPEDSAGVDLSQANERNRTRSAQRYLKHVRYGNRTPYLPDLTAAGPAALPTDWCFDLVFDYGEHDLLAPIPDDTAQPWICRADPFSSYRSRFEVRIYRLCRRVLMFHSFPGQPAVGADCLVRSTDLSHAASLPGTSEPFYSYVLSITQTGYARNPAGGYFSQSYPSLQFEYTQAEIDETVRDVDPESLKNLPSGIDSQLYRWLDLDGEGLAGILTEQGGGWFYKPNLSPANQQAVGDELLTLPWFGPVEQVARQPSLASLASGRQQLMSLSGNGRLDLVELDSPTPGFFERTEHGGWEPFQAFRSLPVLDWQSPDLKFIDLTGDGLPDLLVSEEDAFRWHASLSSAGFGSARRVLQSFDEEKGPRLVFSDGSESIFLADMSGDGLTDLVRIRLGEVCYWPNLGYGRFGHKVTMDQSPRFDRPNLFDGRRIQLADIDGSGTADIIYFAGDEVRLYFNQSGNALGAVRTLSHFPDFDSAASVTVIDLLGNGTACLVWSSPLAGSARRPMRYIDLMGGHKPHLLVRTANNLGAETVVQYAPSTKFYVADKLAGTPWLTRVPFPVHVVERVETYDYVSRNRFVTRYAYHHGYYDGVEREFRGFGRVDQWDTEELATLASSDNFPQAMEPASNVPPTLTKTWFHTGAFFGGSRISRHLVQEYYSEGDSSDVIAGLTQAQLEAMLLDDTVLPTTVLLPDGSRIAWDLSGEEMREACRALRGSMLRQEIYAVDSSDDSDRPYSVAESNFTIEVLQPRGPNRFGAFFVHPRESIDYHYERKLYQVVGGVLADGGPPPPGAKTAADPRVLHAVTLASDPFGNVLESMAIGYGRRYLDPALTPADQEKQSALQCTYLESSYTLPVIADDSYRVPSPAQTSRYELLPLQPSANQPGITNLFRFEELQGGVQAASDGAHDVAFEDRSPSGLNAGQPYRRLIERTRVLYRPDDMGAAAADANALLPLGQLGSLGLLGAQYRLAFIPGLISKVYQRGGNALLPAPAGVLGSTAADGGSYADLDGDGCWWLPSWRVFMSPAAATPAAEKSEALKHFYAARRFVDPFGAAASVDYDADDLMIVKTTDAAANTVAASHDYRVLAPALMTDPNGNRSAAAFDLLGMVAGTAVMGKTTEALGDSLATFSADLTQAQIDGFYAADDPHTLAAGLLGTATSRTVYDPWRFSNSRQASPGDPSKWLPAFAASIARETHVSDLAPGQTTKTHITFSYSDGFGREIQRKSQAEPGPVVDGGPVVDPRWVGSGWTVFDNKGNPVRRYEPFFSQLAKGHHFEFGAQVGVSPILCYDPLGRAVLTIRPNGTYEKVVFDAWAQVSWDVNDTVLQADPTVDPDVGGFFALLPKADYSPTWYAQRSGGALGPWEQDAAAKAAALADTPTVTWLDTLGRTFLSVLDNGGGAKFPSRLELDVQGNQLAVRDAIVQAGDQQGRVVRRYEHDMLGNQILQASMEAGERWVLNDAAGNVVRLWDDRGHDFRTEYDALRRPTGRFVHGADPASSDPRTTAAEVLCERIVYGEGQPPALNLSTRVFQHFDAVGIVTNTITDPVTKQQLGYDFKGNPLGSSRGVFSDYKALPPLTAPPPTPDVFETSTRYDALSRPTSLTTPDGSVFALGYNEAGLLETVGMRLRASAAVTPFVTDIDYDAKGQRVLVAYGNNTTTSYTYDRLTSRLLTLVTTRAGFPSDQQTVQALSYTYDPTGNITHIQDGADIQNVVYFRNRRVEPSADYTYDAIYRLIKATGREQLGLNGGAPLPPAPTSYNDAPRAGLLSPGDGMAMGTYTEQYQYDAVGNFLGLIHNGSDPANPGWTRSYAYNEASALEAGKQSNRLSSTAVSGSQILNEPYSYDPHGNMTSLPQLQAVQWDFRDQMVMSRRQAVNAGDQDGDTHKGERTYYVYDASGRRVRKTTESAAGKVVKERLYLDFFELYREYDGAGNVDLVRETLHVMDDLKRVALVESTTVGRGAAPGGTTRYQYSNHLESANLELDQAGALISYEEYYPFGGTSYQAGRSAAEVSLKRYRFIGKERDEESGFYYHGTRYYAPWLGRWTSCDPVWTKHPYGYVRNNPVFYRDPDGKDDESPSLWERIRNSDTVQFLGGVAAGTTSSFIPGGFLIAPVGQASGALNQPSRAFQAGYGAGEFATGVVQIVGGAGGEVGGVALDATGVGAVAGVPLNIASAAVIVQGGGNVAAGLGNFVQAVRRDPDPPPTQSKPQPRETPPKPSSGDAPSGPAAKPKPAETPVAKNQAAQDELLKNQQKELKEAFERGGKREGGRVLNEQGRQAENITRDTLRQVEGATVEPNVKIGKGQGSVIDNVVKATKGGKSVTVFVETKLTIREINDRIVGQLTNAVKAAKPGDSVILQVARQPTTSEIAALREGLGKEVFQRIQIVSKQTDLLEAVKAAFK